MIFDHILRIASRDGTGWTVEYLFNDVPCMVAAATAGEAIEKVIVNIQAQKHKHREQSCSTPTSSV